MAAAEQWEPDDTRVSRPVLRERGGEIPPRHKPRHFDQWQEALALACRRICPTSPVCPKATAICVTLDAALNRHDRRFCLSERVSHLLIQAQMHFQEVGRR